MPPTPTDAEVVKIRRAAGLTSRAEAESLVSELNDDEWTAALALASRWVVMEDKYAALAGKVRLDPQDKRDAIRHELRTLLGLAPFSDEERGAGYYVSFSVPVETY
jgi:hypothetical protein